MDILRYDELWMSELRWMSWKSSVTNYIDAIGAMKYIDVLKCNELWMSVSCDELHGCL